MTEDNDVTGRARELMEELDRKAESGGYHLNPDTEMTLELCAGILQNIDRHGYPGCPCRLMDGDKFEDLDIICPCDYRDADVNEHGACYCALYVSKDAKEGRREIGSIPERRPEKKERREQAKKRGEDPEAAGMSAWRCKVCGYICMRQYPPDECPICFALKDRFERIKAFFGKKA